MFFSGFKRVQAGSSYIRLTIVVNKQTSIILPVLLREAVYSVHYSNYMMCIFCVLCFLY